MPRSSLPVAVATALLALFVAPLAVADDGALGDTSFVTCGSTIKLQHPGTKARLHSHDISCVPLPRRLPAPSRRRARSSLDAAARPRSRVRSAPDRPERSRSRSAHSPPPSSPSPPPPSSPSRPSPITFARPALSSHRRYGSGSGQQSVTGFPQSNDANSYWTVRPAHEGPACAPGEPLANGATFRLQHVNTRRWLHSHSHASPISHNQEVSCYGGDDESNSDDNWRLETQGGEALWRRDKKVRIVHESTKVNLHSHQHKFGRPISGQFEVCGSRNRDNNNLWIAAEGVYLPHEPDAEGERRQEL